MPDQIHAWGKAAHKHALEHANKTRTTSLARFRNWAEENCSGGAGMAHRFTNKDQKQLPLQIETRKDGVLVDCHAAAMDARNDQWNDACWRRNDKRKALDFQGVGIRINNKKRRTNDNE